jgi:hypothetical protein
MTVESAPVGFVFTTTAVAKHLNLSEDKVRRMCAALEIMPAFRQNGRWWIKPGYSVFPIRRKPGRPKGRKGPYPKGVKRPRRQSSTAK